MPLAWIVGMPRSMAALSAAVPGGRPSWHRRTYPPGAPRPACVGSDYADEPTEDVVALVDRRARDELSLRVSDLGIARPEVECGNSERGEASDVGPAELGPHREREAAD